MKRFFKEAAAQPARGGGFTVALDGRAVRTPGRQVLTVPTLALAEALAAEWAGQGETIEPHVMRLCRLANTAIDQVAVHRPHVIGEVAKFAETDLVCYRADAPAALAARQARLWQPLVDWVRTRHGAAFAVTDSVLPVPQPDTALAAIRAAIETHDDFPLTALHSATAATGSVVIALALADRRIDAETAWEISLIDESYQIEHWGEDGEAMVRRAGLRADIAAAAEFLRLTRA